MGIQPHGVYIFKVKNYSIYKKPPH